MLSKKTIIITGGLGLLGIVFSREIAKNNANLIILDVIENNSLIERLKKETKNKNILFQKCDITNEKEIGACINKVIDIYGKIDALINNAYPKNKNYGRKFEDVSYDDFCENINMHLGGYFLITRMISEQFKKQKSGNIINLASIYGFKAPKFDIYKGTKMTMPVEYAVVKGALINLTRYLSSYLGKYNIRVNSISPGGIFDNQPDLFVEKYKKNVSLGRMAYPEDVAGALLFLLSEQSNYITGHNLVVDGGWTVW